MKIEFLFEAEQTCIMSTGVGAQQRRFLGGELNWIQSCDNRTTYGSRIRWKWENVHLTMWMALEWRSCSLHQCSKVFPRAPQFGLPKRTTYSSVGILHRLRCSKCDNLYFDITYDTSCRIVKGYMTKMGFTMINFHNKTNTSGGDICGKQQWTGEVQFIEFPGLFDTRDSNLFKS